MAGLLDDGAVEVPEVTEVTEEVAEGTPTPVEMEAPPVAERPDYIDEQFWDAEKGEVNSEGLAKSYKELRNKFNEKNNDKVGESTEDYLTDDFMSQEGIEGMKEDPAFQMALEAAKDAGLGVKQAQAFIGKFMAGIGEFAPATVDVQAELGKLGKNGPHIVSGLKTWIDGMKNHGDINDEVHAEILKLGTTAAGIKALDVLRQKAGVMNIPTGDAVHGTTHMSAQDWYAATFETHAEAGESKSAYDVRMREIGKTIFGEGQGTFNGAGYGTGRR